MKLGTALSRFAGGVGGAAASIASKYMDEELAAQRAQTFADIQRESSLRSERELDAQRNAPERLARDRENARQGVLAKASAEREGVVAGVNDPAYQGAKDQETLMETRRRVKAENDLVEGTKGAKLTAEQERIRALLPFEKEKEAALARIRGDEQIRVGNATTDGQIRRMEAAAKRAEERRIGPDGKPIKLSEASTLALKDIAEQEQSLQKLVDENIASGMLKQDANDPAWKHFQRRTQALQVQKLRVYAKEGVIDGGEAAQQLITGGASMAELQASKQQAQLIGGGYAQQFAAAVDAQIKKQPGGVPAPGGVVDGQGAAPTPAPAKGARPDPYASVPEAQALDAARQEEEAASMALQRWGLAQRSKDPEGFRAALQRAEKAKADLRRADQAWERYATNIR